MPTRGPDETAATLRLHRVRVSVKKVSGGEEQYLYRFKAALTWLHDDDDGTPHEFATDYQSPKAGNPVVQLVAAESDLHSGRAVLTVAILDSGNGVARSITHSIGPVTDHLSFVVVLDCARDVFEALS